MQWFLNLPTWLRVTIPAILVALVVVFIIQHSSQNDPEEVDPGWNGTVVDPSDVPTEEPTSSEEPTEEPTEGEPTDEPVDPDEPFTPEEKVNQLSDEDYAAAQDVIMNGVHNFFAFSATESAADRAARLTPFFGTDSPYLTISPLGGELIEQDGVTINMAGTINTELPSLAENNKYVTLINMEQQVQMDYPEITSEPTQLFTGDEMITVTAEKIGDVWYITNITMEDGGSLT